MRYWVTWLEESDRQILYFINRRLKCSVLDWLMPTITHLGGAVFTIGLFILLFPLMGGKVDLIIEGLCSLTISHLMVQFIKRSFSRPRPYLKDRNVIVCPNPLKDYSFPSGHTTAIFSLCTSISLIFPGFFSVSYPIAILVGLSRVYLGLHYPLDVAIGAIIGVGLAMIVHFI
ncbi:phosphatase PAP2 family protein [Ammoniphilus resinae]|uniref:Undecaprenyl-diphosphatase n=1 Tax=Ammoniphilus resinae TaxID=861532 RepID=A0ABS4GS37_9BACL|nr:phosphatase PAP2 family protein [Ammoniphilus resinae]MBP1933093.1 undecaprenyl-diphosphatase [Ammoniphilus resinae]